MDLQVGLVWVWRRWASSKHWLTFMSLPLQEVGRRMGLETHKLASLWKDRAVIEVNVAVLHSFQVREWSGTTTTSCSISLSLHCSLVCVSSDDWTSGLCKVRCGSYRD